MNTENTTLKEIVNTDNPMKQWLVNYVGETYNEAVEKQNADDSQEENIEWGGDVTVEMIVEIMSIEFPEFVMSLAEENFIRGYHQALSDVGEGDRLLREAAENEE